jgi:divalent metal cation (Fe/Co/Zn/Cd) transporter
LAVGRTANVVIMAMTFNIALTFALFATAAWSGSAALLATAIQSLIAASSQAMVLYGLPATSPESNRTSPARANEIFFWSFGVAVLLFSLGAGIAIYDGVAKLADPLPNKYLHIAYAVLTGAFVALVMIARLALKQLAPAGPRTSRTARAAQEPAASTVAIESLAGLLGILIAGAGIAIADWLSVPVADGYAAIAIGLLLGVVAAFMSLEIRNLLIGGARADDHLGLSSDNSSAFFIEDETTADPSRSAASAARSASLAPRAPSASATDSERPMSRKERKRHKGKH